MGFGAMLGGAAAMQGIQDSSEGMKLLGSTALNYYMTRKQAKLNYEYAQKYAENTPSWNVTGLEKAGLNPMLATGAANSAHNVNNSIPQGQTGNGLASRIAWEQLDNLKSQVAVNNSAAKKNDQDVQNSKILTQAQADKIRSEIEYNRYQPVSVNELTGGEAKFLSFTLGGKKQQVRTVNFDRKTGQYYYPNTNIPVVFDAPHSAVGVGSPKGSIAKPPAFIKRNSYKYKSVTPSSRSNSAKGTFNISPELGSLLGM